MSVNREEREGKMIGGGKEMARRERRVLEVKGDGWKEKGR
jgi:hypothetical protein